MTKHPGYEPDGDTHYHMHNEITGKCYGDFIFAEDCLGSLIPGRIMVILPYCTNNPTCKPDVYYREK